MHARVGLLRQASEPRRPLTAPSRCPAPICSLALKVADWAKVKALGGQVEVFRDTIHDEDQLVKRLEGLCVCLILCLSQPVARIPGLARRRRRACPKCPDCPVGLTYDVPARPSSDIIATMRERTPFRSTLIARLPQLKLLTTTGTRNLGLDVPALNAKGVPVLTAPAGYGGFSTTEHTWALILGAMKGIARDHAAVQAGAGRDGKPWQTTTNSAIKWVAFHPSGVETCRLLTETCCSPAGERRSASSALVDSARRSCPSRARCRSSSSRGRRT